MSIDQYDVLGVSPEAPVEVIKAAVKALLRTWHPDYNVDNLDEAHAKTAAINHAAEVLLDPAQRQRYDQERTAGARSGARSHADPGLRSTPDPDPASVDFGTLKPGDSARASVFVHALDVRPSEIALDKQAGACWRLSHRQVDGQLHLDFAIQVPADAAPGPGRDTVRVTYDGNAAPIQLSWVVARMATASARPAASSPRPGPPAPVRRPPVATASAAPRVVRASPARSYGWKWIVLLAYVVIGLGVLLYFQRAAVEHQYSDTFTNGLVTFIGWVGPLPFGIGGGCLVGVIFASREIGDGWSNVAGGFLWVLAAALSIWQAFW